jgi:hypothetical protein
MAIQESRVPDRRVARTHKFLRDALHSLIAEKDYDSIVVKEILDRADVGRSAFYAHFRSPQPRDVEIPTRMRESGKLASPLNLSWC